MQAAGLSCRIPSAVVVLSAPAPLQDGAQARLRRTRGRLCGCKSTRNGR